MPFVDPGQSGIPNDLVSRKKFQPQEHLAATPMWAWGGFVNMVHGASGAERVVNLANVVNVTGLGQERQEHPVGSPMETSESWVNGRQVATQISVEMWMSENDSSHSDIDADGILYAHFEDEEREFVIGLGDNKRLYSFMGTVKSFSIDADMGAPVRLRATLRPNGALKREVPL